VSDTAASGSGRLRRAGFRHEATVYSNDQEFLDVVVPFLRDGVAAGEPALIAVNPRIAQLVNAALGDFAGVSFLPDGQYTRPLRTLRDNYSLFTGQLAAGAAQVRMVGEVPHPGTGGSWDGWVRYEASINHFYAGFPLWSICPYDTRTTPDQVLTDVVRTHPRIATPDGRHELNPGYRDAATFLTDLAASETDPMQHTAPAVELVDPTPADARGAVTALLRTSTLTMEQADNLTLAVSEAVVNTLLHGRPPVLLRAWAGPDRVLAAVHDHGRGPLDPFTGLLPDAQPDGRGRLGLWLAHQLCDRVTLTTTPDGFTVYLVTGTPHPRRPQ
jgi:anti-sigma regulatory factor (Ser/Thr protein kinase)